MTANKGGTSIGNPSAGGNTNNNGANAPVSNPVVTRPIAGSDRAGAGFLTALSLVMIIGGTWWMIV